MKKVLFVLCIGLSMVVSAQGKSISLVKKSKARVTFKEVEIKVGDILYFQQGANPDGTFRFVQDLNNFNELVKPSGSRTSMMKQTIKFFKENDGVVYAFTKYFVVNLQAGLKSAEVEVIKKN